MESVFVLVNVSVQSYVPGCRRSPPSAVSLEGAHEHHADPDRPCVEQGFSCCTGVSLPRLSPNTVFC